MNLEEKYTKARDTARQSCIESACFLSLSGSASGSRSLSKKIDTAHLPAELEPQSLDSYGTAYKNWGMTHGFSELFKSLSTYLDQIYECSTAASTREQRINSAGAEKVNLFRTKKLTGKISLLREDFGIESELSKHLSSLCKGHECMQRFKGKVTERFSNTPGGIKLSWCVPNNNEAELLARSKQFSEGEFITFEPEELLEIGVFCYLLCDCIYNTAIKINNARGL